MSVAEKLAQFRMHAMDLEKGAVLEPGCVYIAPLIEQVALPEGIHGFSSPKSSTGRLDIFTRLITDQAEHFDRIPAQYRGPLYLEIAPHSFSILARMGDRLAQIRLQRGTPPKGQKRLESLQKSQKLVDTRDPVLQDNNIAIRVDLSGGTSGARSKQPTQKCYRGLPGA